MQGQGGQENIMLAQRLKGGEGKSHGDIWAIAFTAEGTARSQGKRVSGLFKVTPLPDG